MAVPLLSLGLLPLKAKLGWWFFSKFVPAASSKIKQVVEDPQGSVSRLGDVLVWRGPSGQKILAGLESLNEKQDRIENVVRNIETAQIGMSTSLGTITNLSMASLGITSLSAGFMIWRMKALDDRLKTIGGKISDVLAYLRAEQEVNLSLALGDLEKYARHRESRYLDAAESGSDRAILMYRKLLMREIAEQRRLLVLNQFGRYYVLAVITQVRSLILQENDKRQTAFECLQAAESTCAELAQAMFDEVLGHNPEVYLDPFFLSENITIELLTEVYQQAKLAGVNTGGEFADVGQTFEYFRPRLSKTSIGREIFRSRSKIKVELIQKLKFLMACLEEVNRVRSLKLRIEYVLQQSHSPRESDEEILEMCEAARKDAESDGVLAYMMC